MENDRMNQLCEILKQMINDPRDQSLDQLQHDRISFYYEALKKIYSDPQFRHSYSILSKFLSEWTPDTYPVLRRWLLLVINYCAGFSGDENEKLVQKLQKLLDHIELEGIRLDRMESVTHLGQEVQKLQAEIKKDVTDVQRLKAEIQSLNGDTQKMSSEVNDRINDYHGQSIAILGIFSAVVLVFMSGIGFSSSVLDNINKASLFRLGFTILLLGIVLSNVIYILLRFVLFLSKKDLHGRPSYYMSGQIWLNCILITLFIILLLCYGFGLDKRIAAYRQDAVDFDTIPFSESVSSNEN